MFVVYYHNVVEGPVDALDARASRLGAAPFGRMMEFLKEHFLPVSLEELLDRLASGHPDPRCVSVTFDDAYAGVAEVAAPLMAGLDIPGAVFSVTGCLEDPGALLHYEEMEVALRLSPVERLALPEIGFPELRVGSDRAAAVMMKRVKTALKTLPDARREELHGLVTERLGVERKAMAEHAASSPRLRKLGASELRVLAAAGWEVGGHTRTHRVLSQLPPEEAEEEIAGSFRDLEAALGRPPRFFAYPYGKPEHIGPEVPAMVRRAGYRAAFSTLSGPVLADQDPYLYHRVEFIDLLAHQDRDLQEKAREAFRP